MKSKGFDNKYFGERLPDSEATRVVDDIRTMADECARRFAETFSTELDFSEDSLTRLEELLYRMDSPPTNMNLVGTDLGCYLGEMLVRNLGGRWVLYEDLFHSAVAIGEGEEAEYFYPFHKVYKRLKKLPRGEEESLAYFYRSAKGKHSRLAGDG